MTHASRMTFTVGERVKSDFEVTPGTVIAGGIAPLVRFDNGEQRQIAWYALERLTPEPWRLLFRAHRQGARLVHRRTDRNTTTIYVSRLWENPGTTVAFAIDTKRPVR